VRDHRVVAIGRSLGQVRLDRRPDAREQRPRQRPGLEV
jgi:hypothetical protein